MCICILVSALLSRLKNVSNDTWCCASSGKSLLPSCQQLAPPVLSAGIMELLHA